MMSFAVAATIAAPAERIWDILTDAPAYPEWNPTVDRVDGRIALGETVTVRAKVAAGRAFPVVVSLFERPLRMMWVAGMPLGLFRGERTFTLTQRGAAVEFAMRENYTGLLAPLITKSIPDLQPAFDAFAAALKARAEG